MRKNPIDKIGDAAMPHQDKSELSSRPFWWWIFFAPGKVLLWFEYMFPHRLGGVFGSARRRNVPLIQLWFSLCFWGMIAFVFLLVFSR
jgi:hypothetical protein